MSQWNNKLLRRNIVTLKLYQQTDMTIIYSEALQYDVNINVVAYSMSFGHNNLITRCRPFWHRLGVRLAVSLECL